MKSNIAPKHADLIEIVFSFDNYMKKTLKRILKQKKICLDSVISMALSDKISFERIYKEFGLRESEVKAIMFSNLKLKSYSNWRLRVKKRPYLHNTKFNKLKNQSVL